MFTTGFWKKNNLADQNHNFAEFRLACICCSCSCAYLHSVSVLKYLRYVNEYFAGFVASYLCLAE